jgi:threonine/homoserine/homoserine lactone efflux protein
MLLIEPISTLELVLKGLFVGVIASAPTGPVGVLCIQRTLRKGMKYGLVTGLGAALSDLFYALITGFGMTFVTDFVQTPANRFIMQLIGSAMLLLFGLYMFRSDPRKAIRPASTEKGTLFHNFITAFLITLSNPLIIFLFVALFARFALFVSNDPFSLIVGYLSMVAGAMLWWFGLSYVINKVRNNFSIRYIRILNMTIGGIIIFASLVGFTFTIFGLHNIFY